MSLAEQIRMKFQDESEFTMEEVYRAIPNKPKTTIRGRIYDNIGIRFNKIRKNVYKAVKNNSECLIIEGDGRNTDMISSNSIDLIVCDHPWLDPLSNKGKNRNFTSEYTCFNYTLEDFKEKARILKEGCFLAEIIPAENEANYEYLFKIKEMAKECGLLYYTKVPWKKGDFVSNTGRKAKNTEEILVLSKGKARPIRIDAKKSKALGETCYMSGANGMLPTNFDVPIVPLDKRIHQAEKPVPLYEEILEFLSLEGEWVLDNYAGSGAVGEACLKKKRNCILIEIIKENVDKIINRLKGFNATVELITSEV